MTPGITNKSSEHEILYLCTAEVISRFSSLFNINWSSVFSIVHFRTFCIHLYVKNIFIFFHIIDIPLLECTKSFMRSPTSPDPNTNPSNSLNNLRKSPYTIPITTSLKQISCGWRLWTPLLLKPQLTRAITSSQSHTIILSVVLYRLKYKFKFSYTAFSYSYYLQLASTLIFFHGVFIVFC